MQKTKCEKSGEAKEKRAKEGIVYFEDRILDCPANGDRILLR